MATVQEHYDRHLGAVYEWMVGGFGAAADAARADLQALQLPAGTGRLAVDLGAGLGQHALALADAGFAVMAVDACASLLDGLRGRASGRAITCVHDDLGQWRRHCARDADVVVCFGDTLTHLASEAAVDAVFATVAEGLAPGGVFAATFRDYATRRLDGVDRFIPVRQDDARLLTCVLDYGDRTVTVTDLLHERDASGWTQRVSSYVKLRLRPAWAEAALAGRGLAVTLEALPRGMVRILARRPA
ncbi:MAG: methyltransferase domain-containing protein [Vicinamibacterales bacterium]